jgi:hypothetical protein
MNGNKQYIGSGKSTQHNGVKVTLRLEEALKHAYRTERGEFLTFMVSPRQAPDQFGKTHAAFVMPREEQHSVVAEPTEPIELAEPHGDAGQGETVTIDGRKLRKITKQQAAIIRAKKKLAQA